MREIAIGEIEGFRIGQTEDRAAGTGCTVVLSEAGMAAGLDVRGGGPALRDSGVLHPLAAADRIHAVLLAGGSAYGLDAAGGVMRYLEEREVGFDVGVAKVPLVCQADLFDLTVGSASRRPDSAMGYAACVASEKPCYRDGNYGAGCGASVGKLLGMDYAMKSGIGSAAVQMGDLQVGALVVVNAYGDIYDPSSGQKIAGLLSADLQGFRDMVELMYRQDEVIENRFVSNTTLGVVMTNAKFEKSRLCKIAGMAQNGLARCIRPVHTSCDGDSLFAVSSCQVAADVDRVGTLAADVVSMAILKAVRSAESAYGLKGLASSLAFA